MARIRSRSKSKRHTGEQHARRLWRRGRERAEEIAEQLQEETIPAVTHDLADRFESLRHEAAPLVENMTERMPRGKQRKSRGKRMLLGLAIAAAVAVAAYIIWQRRDQEPAYLVHEPEQPITPQQSGPIGGPDTGAMPDDNGEPIGQPYRFEAQSSPTS